MTNQPYEGEMGILTPTPTGVINRLDHRGHGPIGKWTRGDRASEYAARTVFAEHQGRGYTMFDISHPEGELLKEFNPEATEILAVPRMQAG